MTNTGVHASTDGYRIGLIKCQALVWGLQYGPQWRSTLSNRNFPGDRKNARILEIRIIEVFG